MQRVFYSEKHFLYVLVLMYVHLHISFVIHYKLNQIRFEIFDRSLVQLEYQHLKSKIEKLSNECLHRTRAIELYPVVLNGPSGSVEAVKLKIVLPLDT
jgi:hypothetical protein